MQALLAKNRAQERAAFINQRYALARKVKYSIVHCIVGFGKHRKEWKLKTLVLSPVRYEY